MHRCSGTAMLLHCTTYPNIPSRLSPRARRIDGHMVPASCRYHCLIRRRATIAASGVEGAIVAPAVFRLCLFSEVDVTGTRGIGTLLTVRFFCFVVPCLFLSYASCQVLGRSAVSECQLGQKSLEVRVFYFCSGLWWPVSQSSGMYFVPFISLSRPFFPLS